jgi:hypothetical protein
MKNLKTFEQQTSYNIGDVLIANRDYLDLFKANKEYKIYDIQNNLGDQMSYVENNGKKISGWVLKNFELQIHFTKK